MNTYLFVWNPDKWDWVNLKPEDGQLNLEQSIGQLYETGKVVQKWSVASHKSIQIGDRAFLLRLGRKPKGIFASGFVTSAPFLSRHWSGENKDVYRVMIDFEVLLNPDIDPILGTDILNTGNLAAQHWTPQASGIAIKTELVDELEAIWFDFLTTEKIRFNPFSTLDGENRKIFTEGAQIQVPLTRYERNPYARKACIEHYGLDCVICKFNFQSNYGSVGKDFIHVHHLIQLSEIGKSYNIDPIKDLRPVCPNCHAIIHKRKPAYSIDEVKQLFKNALRTFPVLPTV
ncbi:MAG TPA: HNH endonuclease [Mucilaginibacter sp.]|jgi:5-methylcytosine-specific restriction protein A|nr:HNH endonuclease [Mucilaginibacter sp.]